MAEYRKELKKELFMQIIICLESEKLECCTSFYRAFQLINFAFFAWPLFCCQNYMHGLRASARAQVLTPYKQLDKEHNWIMLGWCNAHTTL